jgi:hypothetical protein
VVADCAPPAELPDGDGVRCSVLHDGDRWWVQAVFKEAS